MSNHVRRQRLLACAVAVLVSLGVALAPRASVLASPLVSTGSTTSGTERALPPGTDTDMTPLEEIADRKVTPPRRGKRERLARRSPRFTIAVVPDTQQEVLRADDTRFADRVSWLLAKRKQLNLRFVDQTGDLVNWGWLAPAQYAVASAGMAKLERRRIPYSISVGNHDTRAVGWDGAGGYGGDAYVKNPECLRRFVASECDTRLLVRHTEEFDATFPTSRFGAVRGTFEPGRSENIFSTFKAGGRRWMVLSLELWPRPEVVAWARHVVASHARTNVIVSTHAYLADDGSISQSAEYGSTTPQYLFDNLVSAFPNIKVVLSGHVGVAGHRTDAGVAGNAIASYLGTFHSDTTNPVQLLRFNTRRGTITSTFSAPATGETYSAYESRITSMSFVR